MVVGLVLVFDVWLVMEYVVGYLFGVVSIFFDELVEWFDEFLFGIDIVVCC